MLGFDRGRSLPVRRREVDVVAGVVEDVERADELLAPVAPLREHHEDPTLPLLPRRQVAGLRRGGRGRLDSGGAAVREDLVADRPDVGGQAAIGLRPVACSFEWPVTRSPSTTTLLGDRWMTAPAFSRRPAHLVADDPPAPQQLGHRGQDPEPVAQRPLDDRGGAHCLGEELDRGPTRSARRRFPRRWK